MSDKDGLDPANLAERISKVMADAAESGAELTGEKIKEIFKGGGLLSDKDLDKAPRWLRFVQRALTALQRFPVPENMPKHKQRQFKEILDVQIHCVRAMFREAALAEMQTGLEHRNMVAMQPCLN